ncbi:MAG: hypothetical protein BRD27_05345, partial [Bacteroidetes bacterium QH_10_64_19]
MLGVLLLGLAGSGFQGDTPSESQPSPEAVASTDSVPQADTNRSAPSAGFSPGASVADDTIAPDGMVYVPGGRTKIGIE